MSFIQGAALILPLGTEEDELPVRGQAVAESEAISDLDFEAPASVAGKHEIATRELA